MSTSNDRKSDPKEPYQAPALIVYGTVRDLTQSNNTNSGMNDMGGGRSKTG